MFVTRYNLQYLSTGAKRIRVMDVSGHRVKMCNECVSIINHKAMFCPRCLSSIVDDGIMTVEDFDSFDKAWDMSLVKDPLYRKLVYGEESSTGFGAGSSNAGSSTCGEARGVHRYHHTSVQHTQYYHHHHHNQQQHPNYRHRFGYRDGSDDYALARGPYDRHIFQRSKSVGRDISSHTSIEHATSSRYDSNTNHGRNTTTSSRRSRSRSRSHGRRRRSNSRDRNDGRRYRGKDWMSHSSIPWDVDRLYNRDESSHKKKSLPTTSRRDSLIGSVVQETVISSTPTLLKNEEDVNVGTKNRQNKKMEGSRRERKRSASVSSSSSSSSSSSASKADTGECSTSDENDDECDSKKGGKDHVKLKRNKTHTDDGIVPIALDVGSVK